MTPHRKRSSPSSQDDDDDRPRGRFKLMQESGQTDRERRELRGQLRELGKEISSKSVELQNPSHQAFGTLRNQSTHLWDKIKYTREAVLDGDNVNLMSARAARQVDHLVQTPRYDAGKLKQKLLQKCRLPNGCLAWDTLAYEAGACFNAVPYTTFLNGPLQADYTPKERKQRQKKARVESEDEEEPEEEEEEDEARNKAKKSHVEKNLKVLNKTLTAKCRQAFAERAAAIEALPQDQQAQAMRALKKDSASYNIDAIPYLLNPHSFTQTVENMFYFSYMIKKGSARISVEKDGQPKVRAIANMNKHGKDRQAVVAFTMEDWRALKRAYDVEEGYIPHRRA